MHRISRRAIATCLLMAGLAGSAFAQDGTISLRASLSAGNEVPPNSSAGTGTLEASFNKANGSLSYTLHYAGLSGPAKAAHFHGPAMAGANAGVVQPFNGALDNPLQGTATLTAAQAADLLAGKWYVNVHTAANPGGEIRGQVVQQ